MCIFHILYIYNYTHVVLYGNIHIYIYMFVCICIYICAYPFIYIHLVRVISQYSLHTWMKAHKAFSTHAGETHTHTQILYETASFTQRSNHFKFLRTSCIHDHSHILYTHTYTHIYIILYIYNIIYIYICIYAWVWWFGHSNLSYIPTWSSTAQVFEGGSEVESAGRPSLAHAETITGL